MKAIETQYKGYRFRSRLEARWAVFFDVLGVKWEYEPEGFDLGFGELYLPDFRVTSPQGLITWYEVKPEGTSRDGKVDAFKRALERQREKEWNTTGILLLAGDPVTYLQASNGCVCPRCGGLDTPFRDYSHEMGVDCWPCDCDTPTGGGNPSEPGVTVWSMPHKGTLLVSYTDWKKHNNIVSYAALAARSARFEFGESGVCRG